jgi:hypothetical protein
LSCSVSDVLERRFGMAVTASIESGARDFEFLIGTWVVHNRKLRDRLAGCDEWDEFESTCVARTILDGLGNIDEFRTDYHGGIVGMSLRLFDPVRRTWAIYWSDTRRCGELDPPVVGSFVDGVGVFTCEDVFNGRPILVRYIWSEITPDSAHWEQAFSEDGGETWETNWTMDHRRTGGLAAAA